MAEEARSKEGPLSERARRAEALEAAERRERDIYRHIVRHLGEFDELAPLYEDLPPKEVQERLLTRHAEALATVESDRAAYRGAVADWFEAKWRLRQAVRQVYGIAAAVVVFGLLLLLALDFTNLLPAQFTNLLVGVFGAIVAGLVGGRGDRLMEAFRERGNAILDLRAAESLLEKAIREIALPDQLRQIGRSETRTQPVAEARSRTPAAPPAEPEDEPEEEPPEEAPAPASTLAPIDPGNLVELSGSSQQLPTAGRKRLKSLVDVLGSASLGIAGPRGVGKTSLLEWFFYHQFNEYGHLSVRVPAPVRYEPRDFVLSAFAQVCEEVMDGRETSAFPTRPRLFASAAGFVLGCAALLAGVALFATDTSFGGSARDQAGIGLIAVGLLLLLLRFFPGTGEAIATQHLSNNIIRDSDNPDEIARQLLDEISFQLTFATGYSGKLAAGPGELATEASYSLAARQESFPDVVAKFRAFLQAVATQRGKLYIGIDELDKMQMDDAVRFLDDIKGLFGISNCFFLVCISEDALGQFERRGLPIRDAFDSAFDEVVRIEPLRAKESVALLNIRTDIDAGLAAVCHILAGGLPRDIIRHARRLAILTQSPLTAEEAVALLLHQDLQERARGIKLAARNQAIAEDEGLRQLSSDEKPIEAGRLKEVATSLPRALAPLAVLTLLAATVLDLSTGESGLSKVRQEADALAAIRHEIAESPKQGRALCLEVRRRHGLS